MPLEFFADEVPRECTVWDVISAHPQVRQAMHAVQPKRPREGLLWRLPTEVDLPRLRASYEAYLAEVGPPRGFANREGVESAYRSISLVHNPAHQDGLDPFFSTLGSPRHGPREFYALLRPDQQPARRNSYWDTLGFHAVHPTLAQHFGWFFARFRHTLVRSRIATLAHTDYARISDSEFSWHIDESPFCNLRINIPLQSAPQYLLEIDSEHVPAAQPERKPPGRHLRWRGHLAVGGCYSWNTELPHRVFACAPPAVDRVHMVLGFSPWFDWDATRRAWVGNPHLGITHPYDLLDAAIAPGQRAEAGGRLQV